MSHFWTNLRESNADSGLFIFEHFFTLYPEEMERFDELKDMYGNIQPNYMKEEFIHHHGIKVMDAIDLGESNDNQLPLKITHMHIKSRSRRRFFI